jgi:phosphatidylglycerophosphate synthase
VTTVDSPHQAIGKPREIEGVLDIYLIRPPGALLTRWLARTPITPNTVSWLSVVAAFGAAVAYYHPTLSGAAAGSLLLLVSSWLDSADGQLARATGRTSELGETLDGLCDSLSFGMIYVAAALSLTVHAGVSPFLAFGIGIVAGFSHSFQSAMVDSERQLFLYFTRGNARVEREDLTRLRTELVHAREQGKSPLVLLLRWLRIRYCEIQQGALSSSTELLRAFDARPDPQFRDWFAGRHRAAMRPMLHAWTLMASNSHKVAIAACAFIPVLAPNWEFARYGLGLVFAYNLALNVVLVALIFMQRRIDRGLLRELARFPGAR